MKKIIVAFLILVALVLGLCYVSKEKAMPVKEKSSEESLYFPAEDTKHEGTWLTWPHAHTYGKAHAEEIEYIWVEMTKALAGGEKVHIIAYDEELKEHITALLTEQAVPMNQVDFVIAKSDDSWVRDTGPMFVNHDGILSIVDFGFDGWGQKTPYKKDDKLPQIVAREKNIPIIDVSDFILEGGSVELDGHGTALLTKSSVISPNRNPDMSQETAENYLRKYLGVTNIVWLEGVLDEDITDAHIDGFVRFYDAQILLTVTHEDFFDLYEGIKAEDYEVLTTMTNAKGQAYAIETLPLTKQNVAGVDYRGSYLNFYVANEVVLLPVYDDDNDSLAIAKLENLYPDKTIVPINVVPLFKHGGMIHCVTQQQPDI